MTEGKLVRDLIPDIIRTSGRSAEVRYLTGDEFVAALAAKCGEGAEAAAAVDDRDALVEELADVAEVMSALMAVYGIGQQEVIEVVLEKQRAGVDLKPVHGSPPPSHQGSSDATSDAVNS